MLNQNTTNMQPKHDNIEHARRDLLALTCPLCGQSEHLQPVRLGLTCLECGRLVFEWRGDAGGPPSPAGVGDDQTEWNGSFPGAFPCALTPRTGEKHRRVGFDARRSDT